MDDDLPSLGDMFAQGLGRDLFSMSGFGPTPQGLFNAGTIGAVPFPRQQSLLPETALPRIRTIRAMPKPYKANWRGEGDPRYNPDYFNVEDDQLVDDSGSVLATKQLLKPKSHLVSDLDHVPQDPELMYRGLSGREYDDIINTGRIQSRGDYNFSSQKGLTYFGPRPSTAEFYSSAFAPPQHKPNWERPAYAIAVRKPDPSRFRDVPGIRTGDEYGVEGALPADDITNVWRGNVVAHTPAFETQYMKHGPNSRLHWEELPLLRRLGR